MKGTDQRTGSDSDLTPRRIVEELDKYIVGQHDAKRCVAIAIRNRWRRQRLTPELRNDVAPKNIIMMGPTGVGKTEIARRLAQLVRAPFLKVEATKYTEVGYHGRDVDTMVRDLAEIAIALVKSEAMEGVRGKAREHAEERMLDLLETKKRGFAEASDDGGQREDLLKKLRSGALDSKTVEITVEERNTQLMQVFSNAGIEEYGIDLQNMMGNLGPSKQRKKKAMVGDAMKIFTEQEAEKLIDREKCTREGVERAENSGIIFIDEIDKVAGSHPSHGPDVSREGVQRDLLPLVEGATIMTRHGPVNTTHVLFIAAGAFHMSKPSDLIPELQGRFPIRVELTSLGKDEFLRILTEPKNALVKQYQALLETEGVTLDIQPDAIDEIATIAAQVNGSMQNIGARRLATIMEKVLEEVSFSAPELRRPTVVVDREYVRSRLKGVLEDEDLSRYIL